MSVPLFGGLNLARERTVYGSDELCSLYLLIVMHNGRPQELCLFLCFFLRAFSVYRSAQVLSMQNRVLQLFDFLCPIDALFTILPLSLFLSLCPRSHPFSISSPLSFSASIHVLIASLFLFPCTFNFNRFFWLFIIRGF